MRLFCLGTGIIFISIFLIEISLSFSSIGYQKKMDRVKPKNLQPFIHPNCLSNLYCFML